MSSFVYADTSALFKLVVPEAETAILEDWLAKNLANVVTSDLSTTELIRAAARSNDDQILAATAVLQRTTRVAVTRAITRRAALIQPRRLRSLDAIHVATAIELAPQVTTILTYDSRMVEAAHLNGFSTASPGAEDA